MSPLLTSARRLYFLRREGLSALKRVALRMRSGFPKRSISREEFDARLKTVGTTALRRKLQLVRAIVADEPRIYAAYSDRLARSDALTLERLKMLESDTGRTRLQRQAEPPPPPGEPG